MIRIGYNTKKHNLAVEFPYDKKLIDIIQTLPSRQYNKKFRIWEVPLIDLPIFGVELEPYLRASGEKVVLSDEARKRYGELVERFKELKEISELNDINYVCKGLKEGVNLYNFQKVAAEYLEQSGRALLAMDMGLGKYQSVDSKLLTPNGWIRMGDVKIGDKVFGSDGYPRDVVGVYPQGLKNCYEIEFTDGSITTSGDEHLWDIQSPCQKLRNSGYFTMQLQEFKNDLQDKNGNTKWFIPMLRKEVYFEHKQVPCDPYLLGLLLGDGGLTTKNTINFTTSDNFIVEEINKILPDDTILKKKKSKYDYNIISKNKEIRNNMVKIIKDLNLNVLSYKKHIPDIYKFSSIHQRTELLRGLMDSDGGVDTKDGIVITYTSTSEQLIDDVRFLIESLGGTARKTTRITKYTYNDEIKNGRRSYRLNISLPRKIIPFKLPRKLIKYKPRSKYQPYRGIKHVKYIGKKECQCISVSSIDSLYVTDHCILTHNTITALAATSNLLEAKKIKKPLIICPATLKFNWAIEIAKFTNYSYTMIDGDAKSRQKKYNNSSDFTIMNYDLLRRDMDFIQEIGWDLIIADEIQRAKNYNTEISKNIRLLQPEHIFGLTGTPLENSIMDLFTIMRFINSKMFGNNGMYFKQRYCEVDSWGKIQGYRHDRDYELDRKTSYFMIRRKKRDVLKDLPEKTINNYYITLSAEERKVYNDTKKRVISEINRSPENAINVLSQIVFLREICDSINLITPANKVVSAKLDELKVILADLPLESKVVIFTEYERMAQLIETSISQRSVHLHGGIKSECRLEKELEKKVKQENKGLVGRELDLKIHSEIQNAICKNCPYFNDLQKCNSRKKVISKFNDDPEVKVLISTNAGKEGLNLQVSNVLINFDLSFNPAVNEQRIARIDRIGQKSENITIINLICIDTIEERILKILEEKQALFDKVIDKTDKDTLKRFNPQELVDLV